MIINDCDSREKLLSLLPCAEIQDSVPARHLLTGPAPSTAADDSFLTGILARTTAAARNVWHQIPLQLSA